MLSKYPTSPLAYAIHFLKSDKRTEAKREQPWLSLAPVVLGAAVIFCGVFSEMSGPLSTGVVLSILLPPLITIVVAHNLALLSVTFIAKDSKAQKNQDENATVLGDDKDAVLSGFVIFSGFCWFLAGAVFLAAALIMRLI